MRAVSPMRRPDITNASGIPRSTSRSVFQRLGTNRRATLRLVALAAALAICPLHASGVASDFVAVYRVAGNAFLMTETGEVFDASNGVIRKLLVFSDSPGKPHRWLRPPRSFVRWKNEWLVTDMSSNV